MTADGGKLADLSLARHVEADASVMAEMDHVDYVDPALIRGVPAGRATDIYSLGAVLHFVLAGTSLYPHLAGVDAMTAVRTVLREGPSVDAALTTDEQETVMSLVTADVTARPRDAAEVADIIDGLVAA
jgi:eukaryotic-like serine/threonine-protein kinase